MIDNCCVPSSTIRGGTNEVLRGIVARQLGLQVAGLSCITNAAAGLGKSPISHGEVLEQSRQASNPATGLLMRFCELTCKS